MSNIPYLMMTIPSRIKLAEMTILSLQKRGIPRNRIYLFMGVDTKEAKEKGDNRPPQKIVAERVLSGWFKRAIEIMNKTRSTGIWYVEDGTKIDVNPDKLIKFYSRISWHGWLKNMKHYIVGAKLIYFPKHIAEDIYRKHLEGRIPLGHIDRVFRNYGLKHNALFVTKSSYVSQFRYKTGTGTEKQRAEKAKWKKKFEVPRYPIKNFKR